VQGGKELEHLSSPDLTPDQQLARGADAVHLEDGFGDVQTNGSDRAYGLLLGSWLLEAAMLPHRWVGAVHSINSGPLGRVKRSVARAEKRRSCPIDSNNETEILNG
jgi:hypothetical protein